MARAEQVILTNMCMVMDGAGNVLIQNRNDPNWPGLVFPGGHVEPGEAFVDSVRREVWEETGITVLNPMLCGVKQFFLKEDSTRYVVFMFRADRFEGELRSSDEGEALWVPLSELPNDRCVRGFNELMEIFVNDSVSEVYYEKQGGWRFL